MSGEAAETSRGTILEEASSAKASGKARLAGLFTRLVEALRADGAQVGTGLRAHEAVGIAGSRNVGGCAGHDEGLPFRVEELDAEGAGVALAAVGLAGRAGLVGSEPVAFTAACAGAGIAIQAVPAGGVSRTRLTDAVGTVIEGVAEFAGGRGAAVAAAGHALGLADSVEEFMSCCAVVAGANALVGAADTEGVVAEEASLAGGEGSLTVRG